jgi:DNA-binding MarR family transcriptional regulator
MATETRKAAVRRVRGKALVEALYRHELVEAGDQRKAALADAQRQLKRIGQHVAGAVAAGVSLAEVARLTGVSRPTLYELLDSQEKGAADVRFEVLAAVACEGAASAGMVAEKLGRDDHRVRRIVAKLVGEGWLEPPEDAVGNEARQVVLTVRGEEALATWSFPGGLEDRTTRPMRAALRAFRFTDEEMDDFEAKIALAEGDGQTRLSLLEALRMGMQASTPGERSVRGPAGAEK